MKTVNSTRNSPMPYMFKVKGQDQLVEMLVRHRTLRFGKKKQRILLVIDPKTGHKHSMRLKKKENNFRFMQDYRLHLKTR